MAKRALLLAIAPLSACSIFSGWSDLQDGKKDAGVEVKTVSATPIAPTAPDASQDIRDAGTPDADGAAIIVARQQLCGASAECDLGAGCCAANADLKTGMCTGADNCSVDFFWLGCQTSSDCSEGVCCLDFEMRSRCTESCSQAGMVGTVLCGAGGTCPFPQVCVSGPGSLFHCSGNQ